MTGRGKLRLLCLATGLGPLVLFYFLAGGMLREHRALESAFSLAVAAACLAAVIAASIGVPWLWGQALARIHAWCEQVKKGELADLPALPNEMADTADEDDLLRLSRDLQWMIRRIRLREQELNRRTVDLEEAYRRMRELALMDPLTGLSNRRHFFEHLQVELPVAKDCSRPLSLLILDIDYFKKINDTYGHPGGDCVLKGMGKLLSEAVSPREMAARIGGEEFAVILPGVSAEEAARKALEILQKVRRHCFLYQGVRIEGVTVSIGLHTLQKGEECQADPFLLGADKALYQAKRDGRNCVYCCARSSGTPVSLEEWQKRKEKQNEREELRENERLSQGLARRCCRERQIGEGS